MNHTNNDCAFRELSNWHQAMLIRLLDAPFPGQKELKTQVLDGRFRVLDENLSLEIRSNCSTVAPAPVVKTIPVEAGALDVDEVPIQVLLFTRHGLAYMLEILRPDGNQVKSMPPPNVFEVMVLGE